MTAANIQHQTKRADPMVVLVWCAIGAIGYPLRVILNTLLPCPDTAALRFLRSTTSGAAFTAALSMVGLVLLILLSFILPMLGTVWPHVSETIGPVLGRAFIGLLAILFGGLIISSGLHGYLKNFPSADTDD